jgi:hypothetical protein
LLNLTAIIMKLQSSFKDSLSGILHFLIKIKNTCFE